MAIGEKAVVLAGVDRSVYAERDVVSGSETAMNAVGKVNMAIGKLAVGLAGLSPKDYADMDAVASSETARSVVENSNTAINVMKQYEQSKEWTGKSNTLITGKAFVF